jgi:hypothetical protein
MHYMMPQTSTHTVPNTCKQEITFSKTISGIVVYFTSSRPNGKGMEDISTIARTAKDTTGHFF